MVFWTMYLDGRKRKSPAVNLLARRRRRREEKEEEYLRRVLSIFVSIRKNNFFGKILRDNNTRAILGRRLQ